jgi:hypothetical protein
VITGATPGSSARLGLLALRAEVFVVVTIDR